MKRTLFIVAVVVGFAAAASAATLSVVSNKLTYLPGESIVLTVTGNSQGDTEYSIFGSLVYSAALTTTVTSTQTQHTFSAGAVKSTTGALNRGDGFANVFNQIITSGTATTVDQLQIATASLIADLAGVVNVTWSITGNEFPAGTALDFFGITSSPGTSFTIIPEPTTAALLGLGLVGLVLGGRRRS